jgi:nitrogen fixation protein
VNDAKVAKSKLHPITRYFPKEDLKEILEAYNDEEVEGYTKLADRMIDKSRWSIHHELIFKFEDKFYIAPYSRGATEYQDEVPWQYEKDEVLCYEAEQQEIKKFIYVPKKQLIEESNDVANAPGSV